MKSTMNLEEHNAMKQKRLKKIKSKDKSKYDDNETLDNLDLSSKKKTKKVSKNKNSAFRNNYKNYQYDYEEDFYEPL